MTTSKLGKTRGILNPEAGSQRFQLSRPKPSAALAFLVEHYWILTWDLPRQQSYRSEILPFPSVHIAIEEKRPDVYGVVTGKFSRVLKGKGRVFGIKFRPATFYLLFGRPVSQLTNREVRLRSIFGKKGAALRKAILGEPDAGRCIQHAESFLKAHLLEPENPLIRRLRDVVERIAEDRTITRVDQVGSILGVGLRPLQRLFKQYVGVSPKWVIQRYRLQEAADRLVHDRVGNLSAIAHELGYFDQAHFIRDFKRMIGSTPGDYVKNCGKAGG